MIEAQSKRLLIIVAINEEMKVLKKVLECKEDVKNVSYGACTGTVLEFPVEVLRSSMGMDAARKAAKDYLDPEKHGGCLVLGYCGGLSNALKVCDAVIASRVMGPDMMVSPQGHQNQIMDAEVCEKLGKALISEGLNYRSVPLITQARVIESPQEKSDLFAKTFAEAVDMETFEIVNVASQRSIPSAAIKIVIDDVETELPKFNEYFEKVGKMDHLSVAQVMMSQPGLSLKLSQNMKKAAQILQKAVPPVIVTLCKQWNISKVL